MPHYKKCDVATFLFTNQDCVLYHKAADELKFPGTGYRMPVPHLHDVKSIQEVKVIPYHGKYFIGITYIAEAMPAGDARYMAAIDFGVDNLIAMAADDETSLICKGGEIKAMNQWYNKKRASLVSAVTKGSDSSCVYTKQLDNLSAKRALFMNDQFHKISRRIVDYCLAHKIGLLVLGENKGWKQGSKMCAANNQNFVQIPFAILKGMITYKAEAAGITVITQEESYTSKADCTARDFIPVYGADKADSCRFSGRRIKRGLYCTEKGLLINADLNAAANILRKAVPDAFTGTEDFRFLSDPLAIRFSDLNSMDFKIKVSRQNGVGAA